MIRIALLSLALLSLFPFSSAHSLLAQQSGERQLAIPNEEEAKALQEYIKGLTEFELKNYDAALNHFLLAYVKLPNHGGVHFALADTYLRLMDGPNAEYYVREALSLEPANKWYRLKLVEALAFQGNTQAAIQEMKDLSDSTPGDSGLLYQLAELYMSEYMTGEALQVYNRIIQITGPDVNVLYRKYRIFRNQNQVDSVITTLELIRDQDPDNVGTLQTLGQYYMQTGRKVKARRTLSEAVKRNRRDPQTQLLLADLYIEEEQWDSVGYAIKTVMADTLVPEQRKLEVLDFLMKRYASGIQDESLKHTIDELLDEFTKANPRFGPAFGLAANFYLINEELSKAASALEKTVVLLPDNEAAWQELVRIYLVLNRLDDAIRIGKASDEYHPDNVIINFFVGNAYYQKKDNKKALESILRASEGPSRPQLKSVIFGSLGDIYHALNNWPKSKQSYEKAMQLDADNHNAMNNYAYFLSLKNEQLEYARDLIGKALKMDPNNSSYLDTAGWIYYKLNDFQTAHYYIDLALKAGEPSAEVLEHMGDVLIKLKKNAEAINFWQKALDKDAKRDYLKKRIKDAKK